MSDISERITAHFAVYGRTSVDAETVLTEVRAELERIAAERSEKEGEALDPFTNAETVKLRRAEMADLDFDEKRLNASSELLEADLLGLQEREVQETRLAAYNKAAAGMRAAGAALDKRGREIAAEMLALISAGTAAVKAAELVNAALPDGSEPLEMHRLCRDVPERVTAVREVYIWKVGEKVIPIDQLVLDGLNPDAALERNDYMNTLAGARAYKQHVWEVTFVPGYAHDWLDIDKAPPAPQVRYEPIPVRFGFDQPKPVHPFLAAAA